MLVRRSKNLANAGLLRTCPLFILGLLLSSALFHAVESAYGTIPPEVLHVSTDKRVYVGDETITISGKVEPEWLVNGDNQVHILIRDPDRQEYNTRDAELREDGTFSYSFVIESGISGYWDYLVGYRFDGVGSDFIYIDGPYELEIDEATYEIPYIVDEGTVENIQLDSGNKSLIIVANSVSLLTIDLPRELIDATENGDDERFVVLFNGRQTTQFHEINSTDITRTLEIDPPCSSWEGGFPCGDYEIRIVGTQVIPEFPLALVIMIIAASMGLAAIRFGPTLFKGD